MIRQQLAGLKASAQLAKAVHDRSGKVLLNAGVELKAEYLDKLRQYGVSEVWIRDDRLADVAGDESISDASKIDCVSTAAAVFEAARHETSLPMTAAHEAIEAAVDDVLADPAHVVGISATGPTAPEEHAAHVSWMAIAVGVERRMNRDDLCTLGLAGLLHDLGIALLPPEAAEAAASARGERRGDARQHTVLGFKALVEEARASATVAQGALQHHERPDGSGFPKGLREGKISAVAQIVAVADEYGGLVSAPPYGEGLEPGEAVRRLAERDGQLAPAPVIEAFLSVVAPYPVGMPVMLDSQERAVVIRLQRGAAGRPVVRVLAGPDGRATQPRDVDLSQDDTLAIVGRAEGEA